MFALLMVAAGLATLTLLHRVGAARREGERDFNAFEESLAHASRELGIRFSTARDSRKTPGVVDDFDVSVELTMGVERREDGTGETVSYTIVCVSGPRIPRGLRFSAESGSGEDVLTGDPVFDDIVEVHGEPGVVLALLTRELRQGVAVFVGNGGSLEGGSLTCRRPRTWTWEIAGMLRMTLGLARGLASSEGGGICERLSRNALSDPMPGVRLWNLLRLQEEFPARPETRDASRAGLQDASPWVRLAAARASVDEGLAVLEAMARDRTAPDQAALEAVALLAARLLPERAGPLLLEVLKARSGEARRQAIEELGRLRYAPALGALIVSMERSEPRTAAAAATALGALADAKAESSLLAALQSPALELRLAVAGALRRLGTVRSIEPLLARLQSGSLDAESRRELRKAVASIQSRLVGAGAGQLSLAAPGPEAGRVSLASPGAGPGDLSFVSED